MSAQKIVSLVPSLTETLFDLGAGERVIAVTDYCTSPPEAAGRMRIGGPRNPDLARILALSPDLIIAGAEECRREDLALLGRSSPVHIVDCHDLEQARAALREIATLIGDLHAADRFVSELDRVQQRIAAEQGERRRVFYPVWMDPWITVGRDSFAAAMLAEAGGVNIFADRDERYPAVGLDEAREREPDVVLLPDEPFPFAESHRQLFAGTRAAATGRVRCVPGRWAAWYGTRMASGLAGLHRAIRE